MAFPAFPASDQSPSVVYQDDSVIVVRKPSGMHTSVGPRAGADASEPTLLEWVLKSFPEVGEVSGRGRGEGGLLHRLDRETSGLVLFARSEGAFSALTESARSGLFRKEYALRSRPASEGLAGCRPERSAPSGVDARDWVEAIDAENPLASSGRLADMVLESRERGAQPAVESLFRAYGPGSARVACAAPGAGLGKKKREWGSILYRTVILGCFAEESSGVLGLRVSLTRGSRHQVRAHLAWIGLPLLGDSAYGGAEAERLYLHAAALEFRHPETENTIVVEG